MKGIELLPQGHEQLYTNLGGGESVEEFEEDTYCFAEEEELEIDEIFRVEIFINDGGELCHDDGDFFPIEKDCSCKGNCTKKAFSVTRIGHATFKVLNSEYDLEVIEYTPLNKRSSTDEKK